MLPLLSGAEWTPISPDVQLILFAEGWLRHRHTPWEGDLTGSGSLCCRRWRYAAARPSRGSVVWAMASGRGTRRSGGVGDAGIGGLARSVRPRRRDLRRSARPIRGTVSVPGIRCRFAWPARSVVLLDRPSRWERTVRDRDSCRRPHDASRHRRLSRGGREQVDPLDDLHDCPHRRGYWHFGPRGCAAAFERKQRSRREIAPQMPTTDTLSRRDGLRTITHRAPRC